MKIAGCGPRSSSFEMQSHPWTSVTSLNVSRVRQPREAEYAGDAIFIADDTGHFTDANDAAATMIGRPRPKVIDRRLNDFLAETAEPCEAEAAWNMMRRACEMRGGVEVRRPGARGDTRVAGRLRSGAAVNHVQILLDCGVAGWHVDATSRLGSLPARCRGPSIRESLNRRGQPCPR